MKGKTRYILLVCGLVLYHYILRYINDIWTNNLRHPSWKWRNELPYGLDSSYISSTPRRKSDTSNHRNCRMETCFDFSKCKGDFKIYVYPEDELGGQQPPSYVRHSPSIFLWSSMQNFRFFNFLPWITGREIKEENFSGKFDSNKYSFVYF